MTVPDPTAPTAEDTLARDVRRHRLLRVTGGTAVGSTWVCACSETVRTPGVTRDWAETLHARHAAAAVVAAVRAMSVEQLHDLRPDLAVERHGQTRLGERGRFVRVDVARLVGPWQVTP